EFNARHIPHVQNRTIRIGPENNVAELFRRREASLRLDVELEFLIVWHRTRTDTADRRLRVLAADGIDDIRWHQIEARQPIDIEPNTHRVVQATEQCRRADAG